MAGTDLERPKLGLVPTLVIGGLGVIAALLVISWALSTIVSVFKLIVLLAIAGGILSLVLRRR